jgi:hypothetical protein
MSSIPTSDETPSYRKVLAWLLVVALVVVLGLPLAFAFLFILTGFGSIGYYGPPVGQVMAFYQTSAILLATASAPVVALLAALLGIKRFRRFVTSAIGRPPTDEDSTSSSKELVDKLRPSMVTLRNEIRTIRNTTPSPEAPYHHYVADIKSTYENMEKQGLDVALDKNARAIKDLLGTMTAKLNAIGKACEPYMNTPDGYWKKYGELLKSQDYFSGDVSKLNELVENWLNKYP